MVLRRSPSAPILLVGNLSKPTGVVSSLFAPSSLEQATPGT